MSRNVSVNSGSMRFVENISVGPHGFQADEPSANGGSLIEMVADESGIRTIAAYRKSVAFNFALLVTLIVIPLKSWLLLIIRKRTELIRQSLENEKGKSAEATKRLLAIESRLAKIVSEIMALQLRTDREWKAKDDLIRPTIVEDERRIAERSERHIAVAMEPGTNSSPTQLTSQ